MLIWPAGEYPLASSSASERAEANKALRFRRGEMVVCTFTMQVRARGTLAPISSMRTC
jgi:hypothetical protein